MDRDALVAFVKRKLRIGSSGEGLLDDTTLATIVNEAVRYFSRERTWPWALTSATVEVATTGLGTLPSDYYAARQLLYDGDPVRYVGIDELLSGRYQYVWTDDGTKIHVEPAPGAATNFTLWYYQIEDDLATGATSPIAPAIYHDAIGLWASHLAAMQRRDYDLANGLAAEYAAAVQRISANVFRKRGQRVRVTLRGELGGRQARW